MPTYYSWGNCKNRFWVNLLSDLDAQEGSSTEIHPFLQGCQSWGNCKNPVFHPFAPQFSFAKGCITVAF
jgi:hypothetical protein